MFKKLGILFGLGTLPIFACGFNIGSIVIPFTPYMIPIVMIVCALIQLGKNNTQNRKLIC